MSLEFFTAFAALAGLWFGLWQYREAQRWKKLEFAASVLDRLHADPGLRLAITLLDWRLRDIPIPDRYIDAGGAKKYFCHSHQLMSSAFDLNNRERLAETDDLDLKLSELTLERMVYVDTFDHFFQYLEQVNVFVDMGLVRSKDVFALSYWANRVCQMRIGDRLAFCDYLTHYEYDGVYRLARAYSRDFALDKKRRVETPNSAAQADDSVAA